MLTPTWNGENALASGHNTGDGLNRFGREVVSLLEERRIAVDVPHLNDRSFDEFVRFARPFVASHPNLRSVCGHRRNLTDDRFQAICDAGGIVGMNFCRGFLREDSADPTEKAGVLHGLFACEFGAEIADAICFGNAHEFFVHNETI